MLTNSDAIRRILLKIQRNICSLTSTNEMFCEDFYPEQELEGAALSTPLPYPEIPLSLASPDAEVSCDPSEIRDIMTLSQLSKPGIRTTRRNFFTQTLFILTNAFKRKFGKKCETRGHQEFNETIKIMKVLP